MSANTSNITKEIYFIDEALDDIQSLLASLPFGAEIHILDAARDGVLQIAEVLSTFNELDAIHVLSHGATGSIQLGSATLCKATLAAYESALQEIGHSLSDSGDLLIYGCNVAQGEDGKSFVAALALATGADIAASDDLTGNVKLGGDWDLETHTGTIEGLFNMQTAPYFSGVLATPTSLGTISSISLSGNTSLDALLGGTKWGGSLGSAAALTYSFAGDSTYWSEDISTGYGPTWDTSQEPWNSGFLKFDFPADQVGARDALSVWASIANLTLTEVTDNLTTAGDLRFAYTQLAANTYAHAYLPSATAYAGDIWLNSDFYFTDFASFAPGTVGSETLIHEIGHTLGLKHSFQARAGNPNVLTADDDSFFNTQMSYNVAPGIEDTGSNINYYPTTPMSFDIRSIQYLYGANTSYHVGNDSYTFNSSDNYFQTIWDAGGMDTIQHSGNDHCEINLNPGAWSDLGIDIQYNDGSNYFTQAYNVQIFDTVTIENATGGNGNDLLIGNTISNILSGGNGNDTLSGGGGNDKLYGDAGSDIYRGDAGDDTFYFSDSDGDDSLEGGMGFDTLDFSALNGVVQANQFSGVTTGTAGNDTLVDIFEMLIGTRFGDVLAGGNGGDGLKGGAGNDQMWGNAGDDWMSGGDGNDRIKLGQGNDTVDFRNGDDIDTLVDFLAGAGSPDKLQLKNYSGLGTASLAGMQAQGRITQAGADTQIALNGGDMVILLNVLATNLHANDFVFA